MQKKWRIAEQILFTGGFAAIGFYLLISSWIPAMPTQPDFEKDFTVPEIVHGTTYYVSRLYDYMLPFSLLVGFALMICAALIEFHKDPFNRRGMRK